MIIIDTYKKELKDAKYRLKIYQKNVKSCEEYIKDVEYKLKKHE